MYFVQSLETMHTTHVSYSSLKHALGQHPQSSLLPIKQYYEVRDVEHFRTTNCSSFSNRRSDGASTPHIGYSRLCNRLWKSARNPWICLRSSAVRSVLTVSSCSSINPRE